MFRNREFRRVATLFLIAAAVLMAAGFAVSPEAGVIAAVCSAVFGAVFFIFTRARYRSLARISNQIDLILHGESNIDLGEIDEGELSILHSEITKMTLRIREQNDSLKKDRQYLADSLADIAHQLRTPLTSANILLSLLAKDTFGGESKDYVREMDGLLLHMDWLITALLKISRLDAGVVEFMKDEVRACDLVRAAAGPLMIGMELRGIDLVTDVPEDAVIHGDAGWLSEGVQNILKNCMENTPENGAVEISCTDNTLYTQLVIRDSGPGFDDEDLPHLFDRFYRGRNAKATGYGIGLALCKMIVSRHDGSVTVGNHAQGGAVFTLRFTKGNSE
jgi:signal transduction histidine kinase